MNDLGKYKLSSNINLRFGFRTNEILQIHFAMNYLLEEFFSFVYFNS